MTPRSGRIANAICVAAASAVIWAMSFPAPVSGQTIAALLDEAASADFAPLSGDWTLVLPQDHGAHPEARAETWNITIHLETAEGHNFDVSFALARYGLAPLHDRVEPDPWAMNALFAGQLLLFDGSDGTRHAEQRVSRGGGTAGHDADTREVWIDDWTLAYGQGDTEDGLRVTGVGQQVSVDLSLRPVKPPLVADGETSAPTRGFTLSRLSAAGTIRTPAGDVDVTGTAWLDRLWGDVPPPGGPIAYNRLALHLTDGTDLSIVETRRAGREGAGTYDGVLVDETGRASYLGDDALIVEVVEQRQTGTGVSYPVSWRVRGNGFDVVARAATDNGIQDFLAPVWQGPVTVEGESRGEVVLGSGLLLLSGYEGERP
jgi:predicted secreted hydrolase